MDCNTLSFDRWSDSSFTTKRLSARRGYFTLCLAQSQLYSAHALTTPGDERSHQRDHKMLSKLLEQWGMAEMCSQVMPGTKLWNLGQGSSRNQCSHTGCEGTGTTTHRSTSIPREQSSNGDTGMWGCFFPMGLDLTISEHRAEHTAAIPKDWPTTLTRSQTTDCSEQLRIFKNK